MAKRRLKRSAKVSSVPPIGEEPEPTQTQCSVPTIGVGGIAAMTVYGAYFPADSIEVEQGGALWFCAFAFVLMGLVGFFSGHLSGRRVDVLDVGAFALAGWVTLSAFGTASFGNLRLATNEAWLWLAGAATLFSARRVFIQENFRREWLLLAIAMGVGLSVDALHQNFVSLPETRLAYRADPDLVLSQAGVEAPPNSALRMIFENRLFDGGPSATFALANSLAAFLVFAFAAAISILHSCWSRLRTIERVGWVITNLILLVAIFATSSRSALLAAILAVGIALSAVMIRNREGRKTWFAWMSGLFGVGVAGLALVAMFGSSEWFSAAPASLRFRLEYWHSTWSMVTDHPWFGCGPGNFQSVYDQYRDNAGTEQIADPHNFFFETLGSGGIIAAVLLVSTTITATVTARKRKVSDSSSNESMVPSGGTRNEVLLGAAGMLGVIWMGGLMLASLPDFAAHRFAIPASIGLLFWIRRSREIIDGQIISHAFSTGLIALMIHLTTAGGWTIPGIAILIWISTASLTPVVPGGAPNTGGSLLVFQASSRVGWLAMGLLVAMTFVSVRPVMSEKLAFSMIEAAQQQQSRELAYLIETAVQADRWGIRAPLYQSDFLHWKFIASNVKNPQATQNELDRWREATQRVESRCGQNPSVYRQLITQAVHLFQVTGDYEFVDMAKRWSSQALQWSPSNQWLFAQHAELEQALGNPISARKFAQEATRLSKLGNNQERAMWLQQINVVEPHLPKANREIITRQGYSILLDNLESTESAD